MVRTIYASTCGALIFFAALIPPIIDRPFFRPALFRDFNYCLGLVLALANGAIATLPLVILPLMLEQVAGYPAYDTGMLLLSRGAGLMLASALLYHYMITFEYRR